MMRGGSLEVQESREPNAKYMEKQEEEIEDGDVARVERM